METVNLINQLGKELSAKHNVSINDININGNTVTFQSGENNNVFLAEFEQGHHEVTIKNLTLMLDLGSEEFVPVAVNLDSKYQFVIEAIEELIFGFILVKARKEAEENHWDGLIDAYKANKH